MMSKISKQLFHELLRKAFQIARNPQNLQDLLRQSTLKAEAGRRIGTGFLNQLRSLFRLTKAYTKGDYREIPYRSLAIAVGALLYFINPMDLIPDFILTGLLDDAAVVGMVMASLKNDIDAFTRWEKSSLPSPNLG
jgi:uncharacterized membrane protein YkvA (DUF1232 family)